ncbi:hypothetical protein [Sphingomonas sp.]|uniref:hypothetical protein n=1 Tax=Sphingomonas sp. TaxID=28214 RepID=UPI0035BBE405
MVPARPAPNLAPDLARALVLALALGLAWALRDWAALRSLSLPDTDDTMRLVQVRDWLAGQDWRDLTQHRLAGGLPMHWTRLADLGPAALIAALTPLAGRHEAEVAAVTAWPLMLFAVVLLLVQRIARQAGGPPLAGAAAVLAAIAYPATTVFAPGRIDHHGLQMVLLLGGVLALLGPPTLARGIWQGAAAAAAFVIGLETAPLALALGGVALWGWSCGEEGGRARLAGLALGGAAGLIVARALFAPALWDQPWCDGLTRDAWTAATAGVVGAAALAIVPEAARRPARTGLAIAMLASVAAFAASTTPRCLSPYGGVDPALAARWLTHVGEAQSIATAPWTTSFGYLGLAVIGLLAGAWRVAADRRRPWGMLLLLQATALVLACVQLRGAYAAALLATPALATAINAARRRGAIRLALVWSASAGMLYPIAAQAMTPMAHGGADTPTTCPLPSGFAHMPPGVVLAPIDMGPTILLDTPHAIVAAPYHRNNTGNLAALRSERDGPDSATVRTWNVRYVLTCPATGGAAQLQVLAR